MQKPPATIGYAAQKKANEVREKTGKGGRTMGESSLGLKRSATVVLAVTFQRLVDQPNRNWGVEEQLLLDALRRSKSDLSDATEDQLAEYLIALDDDQMRGVVSNVKGIYHEMLIAKAENTDGDGVMAELPEATNQPGYDIEFIVDEEVVELVQVKAVASAEYVLEHLERYPEIGVMATSEVAEMLPDVRNSGHSNTELEEFVGETLRISDTESLSQEMLEAASSSLLVQAAFAGTKALRSGQVSERDLKAALGDVGVGLTTAVVLDILLTGGT